MKNKTNKCTNTLDIKLRRKKNCQHKCKSGRRLKEQQEHLWRAHGPRCKCDDISKHNGNCGGPVTNKNPDYKNRQNVKNTWDGYPSFKTRTCKLTRQSLQTFPLQTGSHRNQKWETCGVWTFIIHWAKKWLPRKKNVRNENENCKSDKHDD